MGLSIEKIYKKWYDEMKGQIDLSHYLSIRCCCWLGYNRFVVTVLLVLKILFLAEKNSPLFISWKFFALIITNDRIGRFYLLRCSNVTMRKVHRNYRQLPIETDEKIVLSFKHWERDSWRWISLKKIEGNRRRVFQQWIPNLLLMMSFD